MEKKFIATPEFRITTSEGKVLITIWFLLNQLGLDLELEMKYIHQKEDAIYFLQPNFKAKDSRDRFIFALGVFNRNLHVDNADKDDYFTGDYEYISNQLLKNMGEWADKFQKICQELQTNTENEIKKLALKMKLEQLSKDEMELLNSDENLMSEVKIACLGLTMETDAIRNRAYREVKER